MRKSLKPLAALGVLLSRLRLLPPNFSPVGSFGFFGGNVLWYAATIIVFDVVRGGFYPGFLFTYAGFAGYYLLGWVARKRAQGGALRLQMILLPVASCWFFLISNLGVWLYWYPRTLTGLELCYTMALPFFASTLLGDLVFGYGYLALRQLWRARHLVWRQASTIK